MPPCLRDTQAIGELEKVLEVGRMHVNVLYTFRSVSRAIPMVSGSSDPTKNALHMNTFKVRSSDDSCSQASGSVLLVLVVKVEACHISELVFVLVMVGPSL